MMETKESRPFFLFGSSKTMEFCTKQTVKRRIADNALVALTLMIAESKPDDKDIMVKVVSNLINSKN